MIKTRYMIKNRDQGAALVVTLILLTLVTLTALSGTNNITLQEKMAANSYDRTLLIQAAEAALREGEQIADQQANNTPSNNDFLTNGIYTDADDTCPATANNQCSNGLCSYPDKDCGARWLDQNFTHWRTSTINLGSLSGSSHFFVEFLGSHFPCNVGGGSDPMNCKRYRITSKPSAGAGRAAVMLQSIYATD